LNIEELKMLKQTRHLLERYESKLIDGTITDKELERLMHIDSFPQSEGHVLADQPVSENNHSRLDAMKEFMLAIGPKLKPEILHGLTARMIYLPSKPEVNTFMRGPATLEKVFLAYELFNYPNHAKQFFQRSTSVEMPKDLTKLGEAEYRARARMNEEFKTEKDFSYVKDVLLGPLIQFYKNPPNKSFEERKDEIKSYYRHAVFEDEKPNRRHFFNKVSGNKLGDPSLKNLKGDLLKSKILMNFKMALEDASTLKAVDQVVALYQKQLDVLATSQGLLSHVRKRETGSVKAFNELVEARKEAIDNMTKGIHPPNPNPK
jgi:hypothetical protein